MSNFIGISLTDKDLEQYLAQYPLPFPVFALRDVSKLNAIGFVGTPQTVLVGPSGKIEENLVGAYSGATASTLQRRFSVKLPQLPSEAR